MGHWSEWFLDEAAARIGPHVDRDRLREVAVEAANEVELLTGRSFGRADRQTATIDPGGLPFAELRDAHVADFEGSDKAWPIPDPVNPQFAAVLQIGEFANLPDRATPAGQALWMAGQLVAWASQTGRLEPEYLLWWLGKAIEPQHQVDFLKRTKVPTNRINVPIVAMSVGGWWFQVTRRLRWITSSTPNDQQLVQPLIRTDAEMSPFVAVEPFLIAARLTSNPVVWAFPARIWHNVKRRSDRPWRHLARAIHGHGVPIVSIDEKSGANEIACQVVLLAYWHGYIGKDEAGLADAVAMAYPAAVARVQRGANVVDRISAASLLLEGLLHPGFDPARGAEYARRYVSRKATIAVLEQRKLDATGPRQWESLGISERSYYKLLNRFASKIGDRYQMGAAPLK
jgi:hypothetical protein